MPKQTKLDEHAVIYQPRKALSEKEKLNDMSFHDKLNYLWEYYRIHAAIAVGVIALIIYIIYEIVTPDVKSQFYAAIIDSTIDTKVMQEYSDTFGKYLELDPKTQSVEFNDQFYFSSESDYAASLQQVLATHIAANEVDVIIAPESEFANYVTYGYFAKLSDELPTDIYSSLTDSFYISSTEEDSTKNAYGIYLTDSNLFKDLKYNGDPYVLGIVANYPHEENTVEFINYLFKDK